MSLEDEIRKIQQAEAEQKRRGRAEADARIRAEENRWAVRDRELAVKELEDKRRVVERANQIGIISLMQELASKHISGREKPRIITPLDNISLYGGGIDLDSKNTVAIVWGNYKVIESPSGHSILANGDYPKNIYVGWKGKNYHSIFAVYSPYSDNFIIAGGWDNDGHAHSGTASDPDSARRYIAEAFLHPAIDRAFKTADYEAPPLPENNG